eukprot:m.334489 g.334489  ORF g.334489 m.334489 type:complete len:141 (-) comp17364_c0_seq1:74-496(-)
MALAEHRDDVIKTVIYRNRMLLDAIAMKDWEKYVTFVSPEMTCFEPEAPGVCVSGLKFHKFYFDLPSHDGKFVQTTLCDERARFLSASVCLVTYVRMTQLATAEGKARTELAEESRIWVLREDGWRCDHFHRSGAQSSPS